MLADIRNLYLRRASARLLLRDDCTGVHGCSGDHKRIGSRFSPLEVYQIRSLCKNPPCLFLYGFVEWTLCFHRRRSQVVRQRSAKSLCLFPFLSVDVLSRTWEADLECRGFLVASRWSSDVRVR